MAAVLAAIAALLTIRKDRKGRIRRPHRLSYFVIQHRRAVLAAIAALLVIRLQREFDS